MPDSGRELLRVEKSGWRKDSVCHRDEGRFGLRLRRPLGRLERPGNQRMAPNLLHYHGRTERVGRPDSYPDAGDTARGKPRQMVGRIRGRRFEGVAEAVSSRSDAGLGDQSKSQFTGE